MDFSIENRYNPFAYRNLTQRSKKMKKIIVIFIAVIFYFSLNIAAQITDDSKTVQIFDSTKGLRQVFINIMKAEDELRFDKVLEEFLKSPNPTERTRAALAAGRIGDEKAIPLLTEITENDRSAKVREMAVFALGEIESIKGADAVLAVLKNKGFPDIIRARAAESAGKIAAANAKDEKSKELGKAILDILEEEDKRAEKQSRDIILLGITAALRAKPDETDKTVGKFLTNPDARIRADAANTLARIRAKNANEIFRSMLQTDKDAIARANAARALGAAEDKEALTILIQAATGDADSRVRVSAIRSLGSLRDEKSAEKLLNYADMLLENYKKNRKPNHTPIEKSEILEAATALSNILKGTDNEKAVRFLREFRKLDNFRSPEIESAFAVISPKEYLSGSLIIINYDAKTKKTDADWQAIRSVAQGLSEIAKLEDTEANRQFRMQSLIALSAVLDNPFQQADYESVVKFAIPDVLRAYAAFKPDDLAGILRQKLSSSDVYIRTAAAGLLGEQTASKENIEALKNAFAKSLRTDDKSDDAQMAILSALVKLNKEQSTESLKLALNAPNHLVRQRAATLIKQNDLSKEFPNVAKEFIRARPYDAKTGTKLGQVLNTEADYVRAAMRKNGNVKAVLTTDKGRFTIDLLPEDAPLTVDNFIKLARKNYFNGLQVHRVVPNFVMQDGDPLGNGSGGPGWSIRCEMNTVAFERGAVGMALSGKDTGGSQWFVTHSPQPHLDGGYTVFGRVNEADMKIVDSIVRGDIILKVEIIEKK